MLNYISYFIEFVIYTFLHFDNYYALIVTTIITFASITLYNFMRWI